MIYYDLLQCLSCYAVMICVSSLFFVGWDVLTCIIFLIVFIHDALILMLCLCWLFHMGGVQSHVFRHTSNLALVYFGLSMVHALPMYLQFDSLFF